MEPIRIQFHNYKLLQDNDFNFPKGSNLYFVIGSNGKGKTSFINALLDILQAKNTTPTPVTHGQTSGDITFDFTMDDQIYTARFIFTNESSTFMLTSQSGISSKKVTEIRNFFSHQNIIAEDFVRMGNDAKGRKEQRDIFLNLLDQDKKEELFIAEENYNKWYLLRKDLNRNLTALRGALSVSMTEEDIAFLDKKEELETELENLKIKEEKSVDIQKETIRITGEVERLSDRRSSLVNAEIEEKKQKTDNINHKLTQIKAMEETIRTLKNDIIEIKSELDENTEKYKITIQQIDENIESLTNQLNSIPEIVIDKDRQKQIETDLKRINELGARAIMLNENMAKINNVKEKWDEADNKVKEYSATCQKILSDNTINIPSVKIHSDGLYYVNNGQEVPFCEQQVGTSEIYSITLQILLKLNKKTPLILMGRAESLDNESLEKILSIAKKHETETGTKCTIIFDRVIPEENDIELVAYEEFDKTLKTNTNE